MNSETTGTRKNSVNIDVILTKMEYISRDLTDIKIKLESDYVTRAEIEPVKKIVYGLVGLILTGVIAGLLILLIGSHTPIK